MQHFTIWFVVFDQTKLSLVDQIRNEIRRVILHQEDVGVSEEVPINFWCTRVYRVIVEFFEFSNI